MCKTKYMSNWDFKKNSPKAFNKHFNTPESQRADAKRRWVDTQTLPMEDIREFEKILYNENKNNRD